MARCAFIENGVVVNMAEADAAFAIQKGWIVSDAAQIGWLYDGESFTAPPRYPDLAAGKTDLRNQINAKRDQLETEGFPYLGKQIDSDSRSVQRINTTVQAAQAAVSAGQPFAIEWTCADDTELELDAAGMIGMPVALAMHANALHQHARSLKLLVDAAETSADLESIDINAGWPGGA